MEKIKQTDDDRLLDYLDGKLEGAHLLQLKKDLENTSSLQVRLDELRIVHRVLAQTKLESPSPAFVNKVMQHLHSPSFSSSLSPRNGLLLLMGMLVATGMLVAMVSAGVFDQFSGMISMDKAIPVKKYLQQSLPEMSIHGKLIIQIIVGLNLVLGFIVLDRTVLKPLFQKRAGMQL